MHIKDITIKDYIYIFIFTILFILMDQIIKIIVINVFTNIRIINILPFFSLTLIYNTGVSFGFLHNIPKYYLVLFSIVALSFAFYLIIGLVKNFNFRIKLALVLLLAGGLSNILDRLLYNAVIDYIYLHYNSYYFPIFNLADIMITFCVIILLKDLITFTKVNKQESK